MEPTSADGAVPVSSAARQLPQLVALQAQILASPLLFSSDTGQAWRYLTEQISRALYADRVSIWLFNQADTLQCIDLFQFQHKSHTNGVSLQRSGYPNYFKALSEGALISAYDASHHPATAEFNDGYLQSNGICSMLDVVIQSEKGLSGVICIEQVGKPRQWRGDEQQFVAAMASVASTVQTFSLHQQLQQEYQRVLERQNMASRNARIGFWEADMSTGDLWWSPMVYDIFGVDPSSFEPSINRFYELVHSEDLMLLQQSEALARQTGEHNVVHRIILPDGSLRWVHEVARWIPATETDLARLIGSVQDITAQQQLSGELQQFFALSQDILCIANQQNYFERVNRAFCQVLGYSEAELLNRPFTDLIHPDDLGSTDEKVKQLQSGQGVQGFCNRYRHASGHYVVLEWSSITDESTGKVYASAKDITERSRLEQLKSEFVSTVSHELRTPLTSISGALALMESGCVGELPAQARQLLQLANSNCKRLTELINDLLDIEKLSAGMMQFNLQPYSVLALVTQSLADNCHYGQARHISLELQAQQIDEQLFIEVDALRFAQVMANLLSNAVKFSPEDGVVTVNIQVQDEVKITVSDTGPGISEEFKPAIFKRFSQADGSNTRQKGGTGLGLALSKQLVENMGGCIGFDSVIGQGASFYIIFPLYQSEMKRALPAD